MERQYDQLLFKMHEFVGTGRGKPRFGSFLGVPNYKPRYHSFIGMGRPMQATGHGGASAPRIPTPYVFHNDEALQTAAREREEGITKKSDTRLTSSLTRHRPK